MKRKGMFFFFVEGGWPIPFFFFFLPMAHGPLF